MRILLGFILALSMTLACDQPYEEIGEYKVGCDFSDSNEFTKDFSIYDDKYIVYSKKSSGFFSEALIGVLDGNIEFLHLRTDGKKVIQPDDMDALLISLEKRWGRFISNRYGSVDWEGNTGIVGRIGVYLPDLSIGEKILSITYHSSKLIEFEKDMSKKNGDKESFSDKVEMFSKY